MLLFVIYQLEQFVCFSQGGDLAQRRFDPCAAVPDSCTEWPSLRSEGGQAGSVHLSGLRATLYGWGRVVTTLLRRRIPTTSSQLACFHPSSESLSLPSSSLPLNFGPPDRPTPPPPSAPSLLSLFFRTQELAGSPNMTTQTRFGLLELIKKKKKKLLVETPKQWSN